MEKDAEKKSARSRITRWALNIQVIAEVKSGDLTYKQAQQKYGIQGRSTILVWIRKHGKLT